MAYKSLANRLCENIGEYLLNTTMAPGDIQSQLKAELDQIRASFSPQATEKFERDVYFYNTQRGNFQGSTDEILQQMHPWILQQLVQKYRNMSAFGLSPTLG